MCSISKHNYGFETSFYPFNYFCFRYFVEMCVIAFYTHIKDSINCTLIKIMKKLYVYKTILISYIFSLLLYDFIRLRKNFFDDHVYHKLSNKCFVKRVKYLFRETRQTRRQMFDQTQKVWSKIRSFVSLQRVSDYLYIGKTNFIYIQAVPRIHYELLFLISFPVPKGTVVTNFKIKGFIASYYALKSSQASIHKKKQWDNLNDTILCFKWIY